MPADTPVTIPVGSTVASALLTLHIPPGVPDEVAVIVAVVATVAGDVITPAFGAGLTVNTAAIEQPLALVVYEMVVVPLPTDVTTPPALIVATAELLLVQLLAGVVTSCSVFAAPRHINRLPVIGAGCARPVTVKPLAQPVLNV